MAAYQYIYVMKGLNKTFPGGKQVLKDIWLSFLPGAKIGVLGLNGAGKSTLLKIMAGEDDRLHRRGLGGRGRQGRLPQAGAAARRPEGRAGQRHGGRRRDGDHARPASRRSSNAFSEPDADMDKLIAEQAELQEKIDAGNGWDLDRQVEIAMDALRCPPADADVEKLSGGERRRVALCRLLLSKPDMLLLDEPTNHLDAEIGRLAGAPSRRVPRHRRGGHPRPLLPRQRRGLDPRARPRRRHPVGGQLLLLAEAEGQAAGAGREDRRRPPPHHAARARMDGHRARRRGAPRARRASRPTTRWSRRTSKQTLDRRRSSSRPARGSATTSSRPRSISKGFGDRLLIDNLSFNLPPGGIVGVIGPNGAGKTTLFKMITGQDKPDFGTFSVGPTVKLGYVDQSRETLDPNKTVWEELSGGLDIIKLGNREISSRAYCGSFNFKGADQQKKVGQLSGGERNRVNLAKMLKSGANVLLLDEPTNDLDVDTLRALEEALVDFAGCAVVISHDRWFLDRIATHMLAFEGDSHVEWFEGNYQDYEADRHRRSAPTPTSRTASSTSRW